MCDCYETKCAGGCGTSVSVHIADWCTKRDNVEAFCPICTRRFLKHKTKKGWPKQIDGKWVSTDRAGWEEQYQVWTCSAHKKSGEVLLLCTDREAYGVYFN